MTEYWAKVDISRRDALNVLDELSKPRSLLRKRLQGGKRSALAALAELGIEVSEASLPARIRLPEPEKIAAFRMQARDLVAKDSKPFGFLIIIVCFGAMPLVDGAD